MESADGTMLVLSELPVPGAITDTLCANDVCPCEICLSAKEIKVATRSKRLTLWRKRAFPGIGRSWVVHSKSYLQYKSG